MQLKHAKALWTKLHMIFISAFLILFFNFFHNMRKHQHHLKELFSTLQENGIVINPEKSEFGKKEILFLDYIMVSCKSVKSSAQKVEAILNYDMPTDLNSLRRFLGMVIFYRLAIPKVAEIQGPLNDFQ